MTKRIWATEALNIATPTPIPALQSPARVTLIVNKISHGWTEEMIDIVQWEAIRKGTSHLSAGPKSTLIKHMNGILPIGHRLGENRSLSTMTSADAATVTKKQTGISYNATLQAVKATTSALQFQENWQAKVAHLWSKNSDRFPV